MNVKYLILASFLAFASLSIVAQTKHSIGITANLGLMNLENELVGIYPATLSYFYSIDSKKTLGIKTAYSTRGFLKETAPTSIGFNRFVLFEIEGKYHFFRKEKSHLSIGMGPVYRWRERYGFESQKEFSERSNDFGLQSSLSFSYQFFPHFSQSISVNYYIFNKGKPIFIPIGLSAYFLF
jgi:hypothetical protein